MSDLDRALGRLGTLPVPDRLAEIDGAVLAGLEQQQREAAAAPRMLGMAAGLALALGVAGGGMVGGDQALAGSLTPFSSDNPLAPSTLLDVHP